MAYDDPWEVRAREMEEEQKEWTRKADERYDERTGKKWVKVPHVCNAGCSSGMNDVHNTCGDYDYKWESKSKNTKHKNYNKNEYE